jgi:hypothetical protein
MTGLTGLTGGAGGAGTRPSGTDRHRLVRRSCAPTTGGRMGRRSPCG